MRTRFDLSGYWHGRLELNPDIGVAAPAVIEREFYVPLPWNKQVEHLRWPSDAQELSGIVRPIQNQNFRYVQRKFNEGTITYSRTITLAPGNAKPQATPRAFLVFEGSNYRTSAKVNGRAVGEHDGGHLAFEFEITDALRDGENAIEVTVDNLRRKDACPQEQFNWQNYGGIYRPVYIEWRGEAYISAVRSRFHLEKKHWIGKLNVAVAGNAKSELKVSACIGEIEWEPFEARCGFTSPLSLAWAYDNDRDHAARQWPGSVQELRVELRDAGGQLIDTVTCHVGLRTAELRDSQFFLNGERTKILGAAWHEQHPTFGNSVPGWQVTRDIQFMKQVGLNAIRSSHYPHSQEFYDACDREGMLVVAELPCWQFNEHHFQSPAVRELCCRMAREMVEQLGHHPCIIGWMVQNESKTFEPGAAEFFGAIADTFKNLDPSRFTITAESPEPPEHLTVVKKVSGTPSGALPPTCAVVDAIGVNCYAGWYADKAEYLPALLDHARGQLNGKALFVTEFGAEGILGQRSLEMHPWTEDYQAALLCRHIRAILDRDFVAGFFLWLFIDYEAASITIRGINAKGLVDEFRRPKLAFDEVKRLLVEMGECAVACDSSLPLSPRLCRGVLLPGSIPITKGNSMSWRTGASLFAEIWPAIERNIPDRDERVGFTANLVKVFAREDMDTYDIEDIHPDIREAIRVAGFKIAEPERYKGDVAGNSNTASRVKRAWWRFW